MSRDFWHGAPRPYKTLIAGKDGGIHLGTRSQAEMRNNAFLHRVSFLGDTSRVRTSKDTGAGWKEKISAARSKGLDAISYLNRYEGLSAEQVMRLDACKNPDLLSDTAFLKLIPEADRSLIALDVATVIVREIIPGSGFVTLYHGTCVENAAALLETGFTHAGWRTGPNAGRKGHLYLTDIPENALWFAEKTGNPAVIALRVRAADLIVDPEDGIGESVVEEMLLETPAYLATTVEIPASRIKMAGISTKPVASSGFACEM